MTSCKPEVQPLLWWLAEDGAVHSCFWADLERLGRRLHWGCITLSWHTEFEGRFQRPALALSYRANSLKVPVLSPLGLVGFGL